MCGCIKEGIMEKETKMMDTYKKITSEILRLKKTEKKNRLGTSNR